MAPVLFLARRQAARIKDKTLNKTPQAPPLAEFIVLMALMISLVALSTDAMIPALPQIGGELGVLKANNNQLVLSAFFLGANGWRRFSF